MSCRLHRFQGELARKRLCVMIMRFLRKRRTNSGLCYYNTITEAQLAVIYPEQIQSFRRRPPSLAQYLSPHQYAVMKKTASLKEGVGSKDFRLSPLPLAPASAPHERTNDNGNQTCCDSPAAKPNYPSHCFGQWHCGTCGRKSGCGYHCRSHFVRAWLGTTRTGWVAHLLAAVLTKGTSDCL